MRVLLALSTLLTITKSDSETSTGGWQLPGEQQVGFEGPCNIDRVDGKILTDAQFLDAYAFQKPVIVYNVDNKKFRESCEKQEMLQKWDDVDVVLNSANTYSYSRKPSTFGKYVRDLLRPQSLDTLGNETWYLFGDIDQDVWKPLLEQYSLPEWTLPNHEPALSFGIAAAGTGVPFHFHGPGFAEVIHGSKRWFLRPYEDRPEFDPDKSTLDWYVNEYPKLPPNNGLLECLMRPGEIIYFPDKWWHATLNAETSVFISTFLSPVRKTEL